MAFACAVLTNRLPVYIFNTGSIAAIAAWHTLKIGQRAKPVTQLGMMLVVAPDSRREECGPQDQNGEYDRTCSLRYHDWAPRCWAASCHYLLDMDWMRARSCGSAEKLWISRT